MFKVFLFLPDRSVVGEDGHVLKSQNKSYYSKEKSSLKSATKANYFYQCCLPKILTPMDVKHRYVLFDENNFIH